MDFLDKKPINTASEAKDKDSVKHNNTTKSSGREKLNMSTGTPPKGNNPECLNNLSSERKTKPLSVTKGKYNFKRVTSLETSDNKTSETVEDISDFRNNDVQRKTKSDRDRIDPNLTSSSSSHTKKYNFKKVNRQASFLNDCDDDDDCLTVKTQGSKGGNRASVPEKKRKFVISDSDSDDLDFGESLLIEPARKKKSRSTVSSVETVGGLQESVLSNGSCDPVCIDIDADSDM